MPLGVGVSAVVLNVVLKAIVKLQGYNSAIQIREKCKKKQKGMFIENNLLLFKFVKWCLIKNTILCKNCKGNNYNI
ncbi:hypothetical protein LGK95_03670 [Clostridium algoriphilum]|uniref:hypothetical protein n=1 Tax=Clostridium algoriphilum TaxID=198347 RepID=UPI001CF1382B|nr:hypothetical protein [Clostridium algoriphilum]MCB2292635.1 hypothetical protein [Clostridium algoriphilum]